MGYRNVAHEEGHFEDMLDLCRDLRLSLVALDRDSYQSYPTV